MRVPSPGHIPTKNSAKIAFRKTQHLISLNSPAQEMFFLWDIFEVEECDTGCVTGERGTISIMILIFGCEQ